MKKEIKQVTIHLRKVIRTQSLLSFNLNNQLQFGHKMLYDNLLRWTCITTKSVVI